MSHEPARSGPARSPAVQGTLLALLAAALWSLNGALVKLINLDGAGPDGVTIAFYRSLFAGLFLVPFARGRFHTLLSKETAAASPSHRRPPFPWIRPAALYCVLFFSAMTVCFVVANTMTRAANAILLQYTSNFWIFALSPIFLAERPGSKAVGYLALAMVGIGVIFAGNASTDLAGLIVALGAGLFYGLLTMAIRRLRDSDSAAVTVLNNLGSALIILPAVLLVDSASLRLDTRSLVLLLVMGLFQFGLPYHLFSLSLQRITAYEAGLITLLEPVLVPVWTFLAVRETVPTETIIGGVLILLALVLFLRNVRRTKA